MAANKTDDHQRSPIILNSSASISALPQAQRDLLIEHYRRCDEMWRHWTPSIWSFPTAATAINIGAYGFLFDSSKKLAPGVMTAALGILVILNVALTIGLWKHRGLQKVFGARAMEIERLAGIRVVETGKSQKALSGSLIYVVASGATVLVSIAFLVSRWGE